ncbi:MAG: lysylphosphatidylglycerol synthase transmembrane domain-containing protein [Vicinamibacteraceae bacterium]
MTARPSGRAAAPGRPVRLPSAGSVLRLVVALGLTAFILWKSDPALVWRIAAGARPGPLVAAILLVVVDRTLMAWRWLWLLMPFTPAPVPADAPAPDGVPARPHVGLGAILHVFFVSSFVGTFLPASVGGDAVRATAMARLGVPMADAVASVFMDRVLGVLGILAMGVVGLWLARDLLGRPELLAAILVALAVTAAGCAAVAAAVFSARVAAFLIALLQRLPWARVHAAGSAVVGAVQRYNAHHGLLTVVTLASIGVQVLRVLQAWCLGLALGIDTPLTTYFAFIPIILLVMLLPVTVNGLGTSQVGFVVCFASAGVGKPQAFALSVLFVALGIVGNLPGGVLWTRSGLTPAPATPLTDALPPRGPV